MTKLTKPHSNYVRIEKAILFLSENYESQPSLERLSEHIGISKYHLQRIFTEWAGVSPKQFLQFLTKEHAKKTLRQTSILESALACGLSGGSRLHELFVNYESVTPGEYKMMGVDLKISYGIHSSPFGYCFIATTHRGICKLSFLKNRYEISSEVDALKQEWPKAHITLCNETSAELINTIFNATVFNTTNDKYKSLNLFLKGSPFQLSVWEALLNIPPGELCSYQSIAESIDQPSATRAVASAVAKNNIAFLIPCHRVIRSSGLINRYRWGSPRKAAMIGLEAAQKVSK